jgi:hypothetical protein
MTFSGYQGIGQLSGGFSDQARTADVVEDALVLAAATVRLKVKNRLVIRALRDGGTYDETWLLMAASLEYIALGSEKDGEVTRLDAAIRDAKARRGRGEHPSDYRAVDVPTLKRRRRTVRRLAQRLRATGGDVDRLRPLILEARSAALEDIATAIRGEALNGTARIDTSLPPADRAAALAALLLDLADLTPADPFDRSASSRKQDS